MPLSILAQEQYPDRLLDEADRLAWLNNWDKAGPAYERSETRFSQGIEQVRPKVYDMALLRLGLS